jgi:hypothetical protein
MSENKYLNQEFSEEVIRKIGHYVYRLIDPRNGETFYVGRGQGNRVFNHASGITEGLGKDGLSEKSDRIRAIKNAGLQVVHVIHRHGLTDEIVSHVEAALIDAYPGLTNEQGGEGSSSFGPMHADEINRMYALPEFEFEPVEKLVLINVNNIADRSSPNAIYEQVRGNWRIAVHRAEQADFVIAVLRGVAIGVFQANSWEASVVHEGRYCFSGSAANQMLWGKFIGTHGKRITNDALKHIQNPIRYWKC